MRPNTKAVVGLENVQLRIGGAITKMMLNPPAQVVVEKIETWGRPANINGDNSASHVCWRGESDKQLESWGCLIQFVRTKDGTDDEIRQFVEQWGPLGVEASYNNDWRFESMEVWRKFARSAKAIVDLSLYLHEKPKFDASKSDERQLHPDTMNHWWEDALGVWGLHGLKNLTTRLNAPALAPLGPLGASYNVPGLATATIGYQRAVLATLVSYWLELAQATPQLDWNDTYPSLTFERVRPKDVSAEDRAILLDSREIQKSNFQEAEWSTGFKRVPSPEEARVTVETFASDFSAPSDTFVAIAIQLTAQVLAEGSVKRCTECKKLYAPMEQSKVGRPRLYCTDCQKSVKTAQRRSKRELQRQRVEE